MNDEQLTRLFRSLDEPADPDPAFADALFARLEREAGSVAAARRTSVRWMLLAATLLLVAALGAAVAVGSGILKVPFVAVVTSPTPLPSGSPLSSASPAGTPAPTASIPEPASIDRLVTTPDGFLAIGSANGTDPPSSAVSIILRGSADGVTWQSMDASRFGHVMDMAVAPSAWILVDSAGGDVRGPWVVWRSTDGQNWSSDPTWTTDIITSYVSVTAGPAGFMLSGSYAIGPGRSRATVWTSPDGTRWTRASIATDVDSSIVLDNGFLAYQSGNGGTAAVFASLDGVAWEPVSSPMGTAGAEATTRIFRVGSNLVAFACQPQTDGACSLWSGHLQGSAGSLTVQWQPEADVSQQLKGHNVTSATGAANRGFLFGYDKATYERAVWTSTDGLSWTSTALAADALGGGAPASFAAGSSAVVALGWTDSTLAGTGRRLWQSPDGASWTPAAAPLVPPAPQVPAGACPAEPTTIQQLADLGFAKAASCYGDGSLSLRGFSSDCGGCGGAFATSITPNWIGQVYGTWYVSPTVTTAGGPGPRSPVYLLPSAHLTPPAEGTPVIVTGHFNDIASQDCHYVSVESYAELPPSSDAVATCRRSFVVTSITLAPQS
jgi:hypothetical protein